MFWTILWCFWVFSCCCWVLSLASIRWWLPIMCGHRMFPMQALMIFLLSPFIILYFVWEALIRAACYGNIRCREFFAEADKPEEEPPQPELGHTINLPPNMPF